MPKKKEKDPVVARLEGEVRMLSEFVKVLESGANHETFVHHRLTAHLYAIKNVDPLVRLIAFDTDGSVMSRELRWSPEFLENPCKGLLTITTMTDGKTTPHDPELWAAYLECAVAFGAAPKS